MLTFANGNEAYHLSMTTKHPECPDSYFLDYSVALDLLLRREPDEEEDEGDDKEDDDDDHDTTDEGYSE